MREVFPGKTRKSREYFILKYTQTIEMGNAEWSVPRFGLGPLDPTSSPPDSLIELRRVKRY
jgi:hypothetical protein